MANLLDHIDVVSAEVDVLHHRLDRPLRLSQGTVVELPEVTVSLTVSDGRVSATGRGAANLSDAWAWPTGELTSAAKHEAMIGYCHQLADSLRERVGPPAHPLELGMRLHDSVLADGDHAAPTLARSVCASAFDAALHDACGQLTGRSAFTFYDDDVEIPSIDRYYSGGATAAIREVLTPMRTSLPGWWLVAPGDDLDNIGEQIGRTGMSRLKIKLPGTDPGADALRVAEVFDAAQRWTQTPVLSVDTNEGSSTPERVVDFLDTLASSHRGAFDALAYLEQPTPRDSLARHSLTEVGRRVPVLADEALTSMADAVLAIQMGWSGFALKTCKSHSLALALAGWAHEHHVLLAMQDLTNIGRSAIHSYLLAAHLPTINGIELNSPQYLPGANSPWLPRLAGLFAPTDGLHQITETEITGLGSHL